MNTFHLVCSLNRELVSSIIKLCHDTAVDKSQTDRHNRKESVKMFNFLSTKFDAFIHILMSIFFCKSHRMNTAGNDSIKLHSLPIEQSRI